MVWLEHKRLLTMKAIMRSANEYHGQKMRRRRSIIMWNSFQLVIQMMVGMSWGDRLDETNTDMYVMLQSSNSLDCMYMRREKPSVYM